MSLGFYEDTQPESLPHPEIPLAMNLIVEGALRAAWGRLRNQPRAGFELATATEDVITHELYEVLYDQIYNRGLVEGFDDAMFKVVVREAKLRNYNRAMLDKMPDLLVGLVDRPRVRFPSQDWLFVECKPVDSTHTVGVHYCDKGIARFTEGEYAWTMSSALMVGYARPGYTIDPKLIETLKAGTPRVPAISSVSVCSRSPATSLSDPVHFSQHPRLFDYLEPRQAAAPISLRHLWLHRE